MGPIKSIAGMVEVSLTSADIPSALDAITKREIELYHVAQTDEVTVRFSLERRDFRDVKNIAKRRGEKLEIIKRTGVYWLGKRLLTRPVLLFGIMFLLALVLFLPSRVLLIQVEGNSAVPTKKILEAAEECGIAFGVSCREVRSERVKNALLQTVPQLQWAGVNTRGCMAVISVRERSESDIPESMNGVCNIVADRDGVILSCTATGGNLLCRPGQAVTAGEVLISGYTDCGITILATRAEGEVYAQTIHELTVFSPSDYRQKGKTVENKHSVSLLIGKKRINLWKDSGIWDTTCDRIYEEYYVTLPGGFELPLALAVEEYAVCMTGEKNPEEADISQRLADYAEGYIRQQMVAGEINQQEVTVTQEEGYTCLTGKYICTEMIGKVQWEQIGEYHGENS